MATKQHQFDALVRATSGDLYRFAYWLCRQEALAQDLVQESYLRAWRSLADLRDMAAAKAWLITILRREHARLYERKTPATDDIDEVVAIDDRDAATPEAVGDADTVRRAMQALDARYREPLLLQVLGGFSCEEIAAELKISAAAVMTQLFRARQKLRAALAGGDGRNDQARIHELP